MCLVRAPEITFGKFLAFNIVLLITVIMYIIALDLFTLHNYNSVPLTNIAPCPPPSHS